MLARLVPMILALSFSLLNRCCACLYVRIARFLNSPFCTQDGMYLSCLGVVAMYVLLVLLHVVVHI